jgi:RNA 3'-terminal phosphate cyclase
MRPKDWSEGYTRNRVVRDPVKELIKRAVGRVFCFLTGGHEYSLEDWGYKPNGKGEVDLYCIKCDKLVKTIPLEDHPDHKKIVKWAEQGQKHLDEMEERPFDFGDFEEW